MHDYLEDFENGQQEGPMVNMDELENLQEDLNNVLDDEEFEVASEDRDSDGDSVDTNEIGLAAIPEELDEEMNALRSNGPEAKRLEKSQQTLPEELDPREYKMMEATFIHLKSCMRSERHQLRANIRIQRRVMSLEEKLLSEMEEVRPSVVVSPPSLAGLAKDSIIQDVSLQLILSLVLQIEEYQDRITELKDLQLDYHSKKPSSTNEVLQYPPHDENGAPKILIFEQEVNFIKKYIKHRRQYLEYQKEFYAKIVQLNARWRQPPPAVSEEGSSLEDANSSSNHQTPKATQTPERSRSSRGAECIINMSARTRPGPLEERNIRQKYSQVD
ncbi:uncharacterized protein Dana_GF24602 [Drosophila ananassae]|uniref:Uncharacterized protein n=1 Tax=Drosophila ananassae TaxID=7217 RepID=B3M3G8_DROAN|nr:uncharacterized protein LOC6507233 [Drosophila ananassae]EDV39229.1 uncharacterized protein Dana_GF24602 [Drosophila ananassae]